KFFLEESDNVYIPEADFQRLSKYTIKENDILISVVGTLGNACIAQKADTPAIFSCKSTVLRKSTVNPWFLTTYLNSTTGKQLLLRNARGAVQLGLNLVDLQRLKIPVFERSLISKIERTVKSAKDLRTKAKSLHEEAKQALLSALGLEDWQPPTPLTYEASSKEVFESGRIDAEFFQPGKTDLEKRVKLAGAWTLSELGEVVSGYPWKSDYFREPHDEGYPFARIRDCKPGVLDPNQLDRLEMKHVAEENQITAQTGDILIGMDGLKYFYASLVGESIFVNQRVSWFQPNKDCACSSEYLHMVINSIIGQSQLLRQMTIAQTVGHITNDNVRNLLIPKLSQREMDKVGEKFNEAVKAEQHSKSLLERAKRAVEIAIEESEETALAYLDGKHYLADELLPKLFSPNRHYIDLATVQRTIEAEALVYEPTTINRYLHEWTREGRIHDAGRGWYSNLPNAFQPVLETPPLPELEKLLRKKFPLLEFTVWGTRQFTTFFHHYAARHATFLMVDRDAMEPVADVLSKAGHHVVIHPLGEAAKNFALTQDETIILRPRLSSDHKETFAPIEQMLVDFHHEIQKLGLFDLAEFQSVFENLANRYRLNIPALKRYAERRKTDSTELLKLGGIF
ncbi:MAG: DUF6577 family protein, partial [Verrucomicrobiota bacterium]